MDLLKFFLVCLTLVLVVALMGAYPTVAVGLTAISIVGLFILSKE